MPTLTPVPPRPAMPAAYEAKRSLYLADCARFNGTAEHYDDVLPTALCDLADTVSDALQLWMDAERMAAIRIETHHARLGIVPLRRPYAARRGFPAHMGRMARRLLPRSRFPLYSGTNGYGTAGPLR